MGSSRRGRASLSLSLLGHFGHSILSRSWHPHPLSATSGDSWNASSPQASFVSEKHPGNGWLDEKFSVCCRLGQCLPQPTLSLWGYLSICSMLPREGQTFCKMYGLVGLHTDCFSWKGCYSESEPPPRQPRTASRPCQAQAGAQRASRSWNERCLWSVHSLSVLHRLDKIFFGS